MKICAVVVTYNRLNLLKICVNAIKNQSYKLDEIIVINNSSTDGTLEWLAEQESITSITLPNGGATPSFSYGMEYGVKNQYDWIWVMDDDSIPDAFSLQTMVNLIGQKENIGYVTPSVVWKDDSSHVMNTQHMFKTKLNFYKDLQCGVIKSDYASFVGLLISAKAIKRVGLPISEYFIWNDDVEFTERINKVFTSYLVFGSKVVHSTPENHSPSLRELSKQNIFKFKYGFRNKIHLIRSRYNFSWRGYVIAFLWLVYNVALVIFNKPQFTLVLLWSGLKGFFFYPKTKMVYE